MCAQAIFHCEPTIIGTIKKENKSHKRLNEVQGLRGVAIIGVLLFHLWPSKFPAGFLGVDIFFVISGYLMCMLLSRNAPLNFLEIVDFYFRRLKRIFPTYLFVILLVLFAGWLLISPSDYKDFYDETIKPLIIAANVPGDENNDYFAQDQGHYAFFMHMWSLSVELQFYVFVPFLVLFLHRTPLKCQIITITLLAIVSFFIQFHSSKNYEHMALEGRVWQFMFGFLSHYASNYNINKDQLVNGANLKLAPLLSKMKFFDNFLIPIALIISTLIQLTPCKQLNRMIVCLLSLAIISRPEKNHLLSAPFLVYLGDISYSVYLIHWSILEYYRYVNVALFAFYGGTTLLGGLFLILAFILLGHLIEELFKNLNKYLNSWKSLIGTIFVLYALTFVMMQKIKNDTINLDFDATVRPKNSDQILKKAIEFYEHFDDPTPLNKMDSIEWSHKFTQAAHNRPWYCNSEKLPANYTEDRSKLGRLSQTACVVKGDGNKTIVLFGNSHARMYFPGLLHHFKGVYKDVTLFNHNGCSFVGTKDNDATAKVCTKEREALLPLLRKWSHPIDIIVFAQAYTIKVDPPLNNNREIEEDPIFRSMQSFFSNLSEIAREVVFVPTVHFYGGIKAYSSVFHRKLLLEQSLDVFRTPIEFIENYHPNTRKRVSAVKCDKCLKIDLANVWCRRTERICDTMDQERRVSLFTDAHHVNIYGSLFVGKFLRSQYDEWMRNEAISESSEE